MIQKYNQRLPVCSYCLKPGHGAFNCLRKPKKTLTTYKGLTVSSSFGGKRKPMARSTKGIRKESVKAATKRKATSTEWYELNPPDNADGTWNCYLRISPYCERTMTRQSMNLEHMITKVDAPHRKYDVTNIAAACQPCNKLKGGKSYIDGKLV